MTNIRHFRNLREAQTTSGGVLEIREQQSCDQHQTFWKLEGSANDRTWRVENGRAYRVRTDDIYLVRVALYQLS